MQISKTSRPKYSLSHFKRGKSIFKKSISKKFRKQFYCFTCILPNYLAHDIPKEFLKIAILKIWQLVFLWGVKSSWIMCDSCLNGILPHILQFGSLLPVDGWLNIIKILMESNLFWSQFLSCWSNFMRWTLRSKDGFNPVGLASNWI